MACFKYLLRSVALFLVTSTLVRAVTEEEKCGDLMYKSMESIVSQNDMITNLAVEIISELKVNVKEIKESLKLLEQRMDKLEVEDVPAIKDDVSFLKNSYAQMNGKIEAIEETTGAREVMIVSEEESAGEESCVRVCAGTTGRDTDWYDGSNSVYYDVDISGCDFRTIPTVTTSIEGTGQHYRTTGTASIYHASANSFRIYLYNSAWNPKGEQAESKQWNVEWVAVGYTC